MSTCNYIFRNVLSSGFQVISYPLYITVAASHLRNAVKNEAWGTCTSQTRRLVSPSYATHGILMGFNMGVKWTLKGFTVMGFDNQQWG